MKKIFILILVLFVSVFLITGCSSESKDKQLIIDAKSKVEKISTQIFENKENISSILGSAQEINSEDFEALFLSYGRDMLINLEEEYNKGTKVYIKYNNDEVNGMTTGEDKSDNRKYHIYIGSETYTDLWSYATIDLNTGNISWKDNY